MTSPVRRALGLALLGLILVTAFGGCGPSDATSTSEAGDASVSSKVGTPSSNPRLKYDERKAAQQAKNAARK